MQQRVPSRQKAFGLVAPLSFVRFYRDITITSSQQRQFVSQQWPGNISADY